MKRFFSWPTICFYSLAVILISILPLGVPPELVFLSFDKVIHGLVYVILSFIAVNTFYLKKNNRPHIAGFSYAFSLSLFIELIQFFLPYRNCEPADLFSNFLGSILGCLLRVV